MVRSFLGIATGTKRIIACDRHFACKCRSKGINKIIKINTKILHWQVQLNNNGEANTCPSEEKSMSFHSDAKEQVGHKKIILLARIFKSLRLDRYDPSLFQAGIFVFYDKNETENIGCMQQHLL